MTTEDLQADFEIRRVLARYCHGIDRRDHELVRSCYHENAITEHMTFSGKVADFLDTLETGRFRMRFHHLGMPLIDIAGDVAHVETPHTASHIVRPDADGPERVWVLWLRYQDRFERRDGEWRIAHRVVRFDGDLVIPATDSLIPREKQENPR
jgi:SnoaL-like protein